MNQPVPADLRAAVRERRSMLEQLSLDLHGTPETRFEEHYAVEQLAGRLAAEGFEVNKGVAGLPTAFTAVHRGPVDGPTVAVLLEYDALPGIGHACGHNLIAAAWTDRRRRRGCRTARPPRHADGDRHSW